jgi:hypothetical protein
LVLSIIGRTRLVKGAVEAERFLVSSSKTAEVVVRVDFVSAATDSDVSPSNVGGASGGCSERRHTGLRLERWDRKR